MEQMAHLFGTGWPWLLLAGVWSLGSGWYLRHGWTAAADAALAGDLSAARREAQQWQADADSQRRQVQALEADLVAQRHRMADVEVASATELQMLSMKLASNQARAAGADQAHEASLQAMAERDRAVAAPEAQCLAAESAAGDVRARAEAYRAAAAGAATELAAARNAWDIERATLADELGLKLAAQQREDVQALAAVEHEAATLAAEVMHLTHVQLRAGDLLAQLEATRAALRAKDDMVAKLEMRVLLLSPLPGRVAVTESELALLRRKLADRDAALTRLWAEASRAAPGSGRHEDVKRIDDALKGGIRR